MNHRKTLRWTTAFVIFMALALLGVTLVPRLQTACAERETRTTAFPATSQPDQVCLTWSADPKTTRTVQWRTSPATGEGVVQYRLSTAAENDLSVTKAIMSVIRDPGTSNDPENHRFSATLQGLQPGAEYAYRVGSGDTWSDWAAFKTAPADAAPFSFIYMGDPQVGLDSWGRLLHAAYERHPDAAFYVVAGDNVNRGHCRNEWDDLFHAASGVFDRRSYVPTPGNHDYSRMDTPRLYLDLLTLPENGPAAIGPERAYAFHYGNALVVVLDSNASVEDQCSWLEDQLKSTSATWKFAVYHHPAYSSAPNRDNIEVREKWGALFDTYHLDMALQGHDHGYLRTPPMRAGKEAASPAEGTVYVVSVSGTKYYEVENHPYAAKVIDHKSTYQHIDLSTDNGNTLTYRAYDMEGNVQDELVITK